MPYLAMNVVAEHGGGLNVLLLFGLIVLLGTFASRLFQKFHIPQVVGCIVVGILLGDVFNIITEHTLDMLKPFTMFALGVIGFMIGGELRGDVFKKYGRQFFVILLSQGIGAFVLVAVTTCALSWVVTGNLSVSLAMGLLLGAIASATAPAATVNVLWEYKTRGPLTVAILAIVALDDALALLLYRAAATGAQALVGTGHDSVLATTIALLAEIIGAVLLGFIVGVMLFWLLKFVKANDKILEFAIALLSLVVGVSIIFDIDPILPTMMFGITIANLMPRRSKATFQLVEQFSPPIYTTFFVLAGAHMQFERLQPWLITMILVYIVCRAVGKIAGSWYGAKYSAAPASVQKYLGICLLPQAGVAIGLAIMVSRQFDPEIGHAVVMIVMTATFIMEIIGPMLVKVGVKKAGEVGLNVTEDDLIEIYNIADVMDKKVPVIPAGAPLSEVIKVVSSTDNFYYSVVDKNEKIIGSITLDGIRNTFTTQELNDWLVAMDITEPVITIATPDTSLAEGFAKMKKFNVEYIPIVASDEDYTYVGILGERSVHRRLSTEVLAKQKEADQMYSISAVS